MPVPAAATEITNEQDVDDLAALVEQSTPKQFQVDDVSASATLRGRFVARSELVDVNLPSESGEPIQIDRRGEGGAFRISVTPELGFGAEAELASDGSVVYLSQHRASGVVQATSNGVRMHAVLADPQAPTSIRYKVDLPDGARLVPFDVESPRASASGVVILSPAGEILGGFSQPWAIDAQGRSIATHYVVSAGYLTQVVETDSVPTVAFPVVADPYLGFDLIKRAEWDLGSKGWTLKVTPTGWARSLAGSYAAGVAGWDELYDKYKK